MAPELIMKDNRGQKIFIFTNNQAAIFSLKKAKQWSGEYLLQKIVLRIKASFG